MKKLILVPFLFIFLPTVLAAPQFLTVSPANNSYTFGRDTDVFSISISDANLDTSSVKLFIRVFEPGSSWHSNTTPYCSLATVWTCSATISGFGGLAGDGKAFIFYWNASNATGETNSSENYFIIVDRSPPQINFTNPTDGAYVGGSQIIKINAVDLYSGVNGSTVQYSFDNSTFYNTVYSAGVYASETAWSTGTYSNNQSVAIYARAKDNTMNQNYSNINVRIDNEMPTLLVTKPGDTLTGLSNFEISVADIYSGIDNSTVKYTVADQSAVMACIGTIYNFNCTSIFNSLLINDGSYILTFSASDKSNNTKQNTTSVVVDNNAPTVSILSPSNGSYVHGTTAISATANDTGKGVSVVKLTIDGNAVEFSCSGTTNSKSCTYSWNTATAIEGNHTIVVSSTDVLGYSSEKTIKVFVDNSKPNITISSPTQINLKGIVTFNITVIDNEIVNKNSILYRFNNTTTTMACSEIIGNKSLICNSTFDSSVFLDGAYTLQFLATDMAGNEQTQSMNIRIDNKPPEVSDVAVSPIISRFPTNFKISAVMTDAGSHVVSAKARIIYPDGKFIEVSFKKSTENNWEYSFYSDNQGKHIVDIIAIDNSSNSVALNNMSQFFVGSLNCGNNICDADENYCFCSKDCTAPVCKENEIVGCASGIPTCIEKPVCGNGKCEEGEDCSSCLKDCGECKNETAGFRLDLSNTSILIILGVCVAAVASFLAFKFLTRPKKVYPGFKPKESFE